MPTPTRQTLFLVCLAALSLQSSHSFQSPVPSTTHQHQLTPTRISSPRHTTAATTTSLSLSSSSGGGGFGNNDETTKAKTSSSPPSLSSPAGDFAFQEMLVLLTAMQKEGATSRDMDPAKRRELEGYVRTVLANNSHKSLRLQDIGRAIVPQSEWKLMFSSSEAVLESLPKDATVFLKIKNEQELDYVLKFSKKTMGLDSLTAKCKYTFDVSCILFQCVGCRMKP